MENLGFVFDNAYFTEIISPKVAPLVFWIGLAMGLAWWQTKKKGSKIVEEIRVNAHEALKDMKDAVDTMNSHFKSMEKTVNDKLTDVVSELSNFKSVVREDLAKGDARMTRIEQRVEKLEITKTQGG